MLSKHREIFLAQNIYMSIHNFSRTSVNNYFRHVQHFTRSIFFHGFILSLSSICSLTWGQIMCYIALKKFLNKSFHLILIILSQNAQNAHTEFHSFIFVFFNSLTLHKRSWSWSVVVSITDSRFRSFFTFISLFFANRNDFDPDKFCTLRRGSTPVSTVLRKSVRFFLNRYIFNKEKTFQVARLYPRWMELANILSEWLGNPRKETLGS